MNECVCVCVSRMTWHSLASVRSVATHTLLLRPLSGALLFLARADPVVLVFVAVVVLVKQTWLLGLIVTTKRRLYFCWQVATIKKQLLWMSDAKEQTLDEKQANSGFILKAVFVSAVIKEKSSLTSSSCALYYQPAMFINAFALKTPTKLIFLKSSNLTFFYIHVFSPAVFFSVFTCTLLRSFVHYRHLWVSGTAWHEENNKTNQ